MPKLLNRNQLKNIFAAIAELKMHIDDKHEHQDDKEQGGYLKQLTLDMRQMQNFFCFKHIELISFLGAFFVQLPPVSSKGLVNIQKKNS